MNKKELQKELHDIVINEMKGDYFGLVKLLEDKGYKVESRIADINFPSYTLVNDSVYIMHESSVDTLDDGDMVTPDDFVIAIKN